MPDDSYSPIDKATKEFRHAWLGRSVFRVFEEVCAKYPNRLALKDSRHEFDYRGVHLRCQQLAHAVREIHIGKEPVGIALPNNAHFPIAMMAVLANGCPYVPLDLDLPKARNEWIIRHSGAKTLIASKSHGIPAFDGPVIYIEDMDLDRPVAFIDSSDPEDTAYIIYTSGSTGIPKGVYQNQRNLMHDVMQYTQSIRLSHTDRSTLLYSPSVNGAIRDIYGSLLNGASLFIRKMTDNGLYGLAEFIREEGITVYHSIPNIFRTFLGLDPQMGDLSSVRIVYLAGDRIFKSDVNLFKGYFPDDALLYVGIGATEIATIYRQWLISKSTVVEKDPIPLGYAVTDRDMRIVDENGHEVPHGETGEITVTSEYISLGYWNDPEQTSRRFRNAPEGLKGRTYSTGDLGRIDSAGMLEFIGRKDKQVKINGYRVEIAEVESRIMDSPGVERCAVDTMDSDAGKVLVALFTSRQKVEASELRNSLRERLPAYMIPRHIIRVDEIPVMYNFKNDKAGIRELIRLHLQTDQGQAISERGHNGNDAVSDAVKAEWLRHLDCESYDRNLSWTAAGGDSISALRFLSRLESSLQSRFPMKWFSGDFTASDVRDHLNNRNNRPTHAVIHDNYPLGKGKDPLKLYSILTMGRNFGKMAEICRWEWSVIHLMDQQTEKGETPDDEVETIARAYADAILKEHESGPIVLMGRCINGIDAYATACHLQKKTDLPIHVLLFDTRYPTGTDQRQSHPSDRTENLFGIAIRRLAEKGLRGSGTAQKALRRIVGEALEYRLFDPEWYISNHPDVAKAGVDPLSHYFAMGWRENRIPSPVFDHLFYGSICLYFQPGLQNPVLHYMISGRLKAPIRKSVRELHITSKDCERIMASGWFDADWYVREHPHATSEGCSPLEHYMAFGWRFGRIPYPGYNPDRFASRFPGFEPDKVNPLRHMLNLPMIPTRPTQDFERTADERYCPLPEGPLQTDSKETIQESGYLRKADQRKKTFDGKLLLARLAARKRYRPEDFQGDVHLFVNQYAFDRDPTHGWDICHKGRFRSIRMNGDHESCLGDDIRSNAWKVDAVIRGILNQEIKK